MPTTVLVADDSKIMRKVIMHSLQDDADIQVLAVGANFAQTMKLITELHPHVVVLDLHLSDENRVAPSQIKACLNGSRLIAMSLWNDDETQILAQTFGAIALLEKAPEGSGTG